MVGGRHEVWLVGSERWSESCVVEGERGGVQSEAGEGGR